MGLPNINIAFIGKGSSAITRSARGIVAMILRDGTAEDPVLKQYTSLSQVDYKDLTATNYDYLKLVFAAAPSKVMVVVIKPDATLEGALKVLSNYKWNYLTFPGITDEEIITVTSWIKEQRDQKKKTFKAILSKNAADHEGIINFTTDSIQTTITGKTHTAAEYCARMAGIFAALPLDQSGTYYNLADVSDAATPADPDARIDAGELIVVFDGEKHKVGRAVNSLTTYTETKTKDLSKIKIVEGKDMVQDDIKDTFADLYVGKYINNYDNKQILVAAIGNYFKTLEGNVLDPDYGNTVSVSLAGQTAYLDAQEQNTASMSETQIMTANTGSIVYLAASIKFVDAMEDLNFEIAM